MLERSPVVDHDHPRPCTAKRRAQLLERDRLARPRLADDRDIVIAGGVFERAPEEGLAAATTQMRHLSAQILALDRREVGGRRGEQRTKPLHPIEITREAVRHRDRKSTRLNSSHKCAYRMPSSA